MATGGLLALGGGVGERACESACDNKVGEGNEDRGRVGVGGGGGVVGLG